MTTETRVCTGEQLRAMRLARDMTQTELARRTGIAANNICAFEKGRATIRLSTLNKCFEVLDVKATYSMTDDQGQTVTF